MEFLSHYDYILLANGCVGFLAVAYLGSKLPQACFDLVVAVAFLLSMYNLGLIYVLSRVDPTVGLTAVELAAVIMTNAVVGYVAISLLTIRLDPRHAKYFIGTILGFTVYNVALMGAFVFYAVPLG